MDKTYKTSVLIIRDGWGENKDPRFDAHNAVKLAQTPCADELTRSWPRTEIEAAGLAVGLPEGIMGNSEVGHQNMGAGRVVDQEIVRINKSIASGAVAELPSLQSAMAHVQQQGSALHLMGLVSDAGGARYVGSSLWLGQGGESGWCADALSTRLYGWS
jgi:2,3-bisphosphoglycerate-independent phosphoglycerate mutase